MLRSKIVDQCALDDGLSYTTQESGYAGFSADMEHTFAGEYYLERRSLQVETDSFVRPILCDNLDVPVYASPKIDVYGCGMKDVQVADFCPCDVSAPEVKMPLPVDEAPHMGKPMSVFEPENNPVQESSIENERHTQPKAHPADLDGAGYNRQWAKNRFAFLRRHRRRNRAGMKPHWKWTLGFLMASAFMEITKGDKEGFQHPLDSNRSCSVCNGNACSKLMTIWLKNTVIYQRHNPLEEFTSCSNTKAPHSVNAACVVCLDHNKIVVVCSGSPKGLELEGGGKSFDTTIVDCPDMKPVPGENDQVNDTLNAGWIAAIVVTVCGIVVIMGCMMGYCLKKKREHERNNHPEERDQMELGERGEV